MRSHLRLHTTLPSPSSSTTGLSLTEHYPIAPTTVQFTKHSIEPFLMCKRRNRIYATSTVAHAHRTPTDTFTQAVGNESFVWASPTWKDGGGQAGSRYPSSLGVTASCGRIWLRHRKEHAPQARPNLDNGSRLKRTFATRRGKGVFPFH